MIKHNTVINVRKLAALDIVFHGANHSPFMVILGSFFLWVSLNYVPLLLYAISIVKHKSAQQVVAYELEHKDRYAGKYTLQSIILLLMPLAMLLLAVYQELQKRSHQ
jgi:hypothetical protein